MARHVCTQQLGYYQSNFCTYPALGGFHLELLAVFEELHGVSPLHSNYWHLYRGALVWSLTLPGRSETWYFEGIPESARARYVHRHRILHSSTARSLWNRCYAIGVGRSERRDSRHLSSRHFNGCFRIEASLGWFRFPRYKMPRPGRYSVLIHSRRHADSRQDLRVLFFECFLSANEAWGQMFVWVHTDTLTLTYY